MHTPVDNSIQRHVFGCVEVRPSQRKVLVNGRVAALGARAFDVLLTLIERRDRLVTKNELLETVWQGTAVEENNLVVQVGTLRKLLGADVIATVPGRGYRFVAPVADGASAAATVAAAPSRGGPFAGQIAPPAAALIGREQDLADLRAAVDRHRLVTVTGAGGVGKTVLVRRFLHDRQEGQACRVAWVDLGALTDSALVVPGIAQALDVPLGPQSNDPLECIATALEPFELVLALDNAEHVVDAVARVARVLAQRLPGLSLVVTSQVPLKLQDERIIRLEPLTVPQRPLPPADALCFGAVALFVQRTRAVNWRFGLNENNVAHVIEICRRLDGLPLAIEMAAARVPLLGVATLAGALNQPLRLLNAGQRPAPERQQSLRAMIEWSHALLGSRERVVLRRLSGFAGSCSVAMAQKLICDGDLDEWSVVDAMAELVDRSLLVSSADDPMRYRLLHAARAFALEQPATAPEELA